MTTEGDNQNTDSLWRLATASIRLLTRKERSSAAGVAVLLLLGSLLETLSMVGVMPLIGIIVEPRLIETSMPLKILFNFLGRPSFDVFVLVMAAGAVGLMFFSMACNLYIQNAVRFFVVWCQNRLARDSIYSTVNAPYIWFSGKNATTESHFLFTDIMMWANDSILRSIQTAGNASLLLASAGVLLVAAPLAGIGGLAAIAALAYVVLRLTRSRISELSQVRRQSGAQTLAAASQIIAGIKDIKLSSREGFFSDFFLRWFGEYGSSGVKLRFVQNVPPMIILFLGQSGLVAIALTLWGAGSSSGEIAAQMALIVLVTSRIIPGTNRLISEISGMEAARPHVEAIIRHRRELRAFQANLEAPRPATLRSATDWGLVKLDGVGYRYPETDRSALRDISLELHRGGSYGVVGPSGCGKSTLIDLLVGLIEPMEGRIFIDGHLISEFDPRSWWGIIGYVPQNPFIADDTLRANVAFGVPCEEVDDTWVQECLATACLDDFVASLPKGLASMLGDRGLRASGGERQRIAIARALYNRPRLLILDEATSALDAENEQAVQKAIARLHGQITAIVIAHRLATVRACDSIFVLDQGRLMASGRFDELLEGSDLFRRLAVGLAPSEAKG